jgi:hypothetical protein
MIEFQRATVAVLLTGVAFFSAGAAEPPPSKELETLWADLCTKDAAKAERTVAGLADRPAQVVPFLRHRLQPVPAADSRRVAQWLADLDGEEFAVREAAAKELEAMGEVAEPFLQRARRGKPSAEVRHRIDGLMDTVKQHRLFPPPDRLRAARAVEVLERINNCAARRALAVLAGGAPDAALTIEAKSALERLTQGAAETP